MRTVIILNFSSKTYLQIANLSNLLHQFKKLIHSYATKKSSMNLLNAPTKLSPTVLLHAYL